MPTRLLARVLVLGATLTMLTTGVAVATIPGDGALPGDARPADRYAGDDRYHTAALTAVDAYPNGSPVAVLARGDQFPDGLAASYLAGALDAPILLTPPHRLELVAQDAFERLGTRQVVIVGGPAAISQRVEERLRELFGDDNVDRMSGNDRFQTAALLYQQTGILGRLADLSGRSDRDLTTAVLASGENFPDALAAGPLAHAATLPILLTGRDELPDITRIALDSGIEQVLVAGGPRTISNRVMAEVEAISDIEVVHRVSGADRTETAARLAALTRVQLGWSHQAVTVALGTDFPDALSMAPAAGRLRAPILLSRSTGEVGPETFAAIQVDCEPINALVLSGGTAAIDADAERQLRLATSCDDLTTTLGGDAVPGGGDAAATGTAWVWTDSLCYAVRVRDLASPATRAHLHGPESASLDVPWPATGDGFAVGCLTDEDVRDGTADDLRSALREDPAAFHVDVHSESHRDGAVRGQLG